MRSKRFIFLFLAAILPAITLLAQQDRITEPADRSRMSVVRGNIHFGAGPQFDRGPVDPSMQLTNVTLMFRPSAEQQAALEQLLAGQQTVSNPNYRKWLTPEQFADRFGLGQRDIAKVAAWLEAEGLTVSGVANGRQWLTFSGTAGRVGSALHTEIHRYRVEGNQRYANASEPSVPAAFAGVVAGFQGLDDFPLRSFLKSIPADQAAYSSGGSNHVAPDDFATIYDVAALYQAGIDGTGQHIAILGQSDINLADIRAFRRQFNLPPNDPQVILTGLDPGINPAGLVEADFDLEWSGAVARNATLIYVNSINAGLSALYAVDSNLAPVMSFSFGICEQESSPVIRTVAQQAAAQGITWMVASGDSGAAGCDVPFFGQQASKGLAVSVFASMPEVTAVGGTLLDEGAGNYWASANGPNLNSVLSYIPERAWNEASASNGLASGGGGASIFFAKPAWQSGPGVPNDGARDVPDVALSAAIHDSYPFTTGGVNAFAWGTSTATPAFAGIVALLNQYLIQNSSLAQPGLGNINPELYRLAQSASGVFHDVSVGDNIVPCEQQSPNCVNSFIGFGAGSGYDQATGLGSVDAYALTTKFNSTAGNTATTLTTNSSSVDLNGTLNLTATVSATGGGVLSGTVGFILASSGTSLGSAPLVVSGGSGIASLPVAADLLPAGNATITAVYSGNASFNGSAATATVTVTIPAAGSVVVAASSSNPVYEAPPNPLGYRWVFSITLKELAGVATTLTGLTLNGRSLPLSSYFNSTAIPAKGTLPALLGFSNLTVPATQVFGFTGTDADGRIWSQSLSIIFNGPGLETPLMLLSSAPGAVQQNPSADASCQWSQPVFLQEQSGFAVQLTKLTAGTTDLTSQIQQIFGTTRLAPFGMLQGWLCSSGITPPQSTQYLVTGTADNGVTIVAPLTTPFGPAAPTVSNASVSPAAVSLPTTSSLALNFDAGAPQWTVGVFPLGAVTSWLQVSPRNGSGPAQLHLIASGAGLSPGVYNATLVIQSVNAVPEYLTVPVAFTVGASSTTIIGGVSNVFTGQVAFAPGMLASVYGVQLAPSIQSASSLPLPFSMQGVSATVNGISAPIWDILPGQLNIQIPYETGAGPAVLGVNNNGQIASFPLLMAPAAPGAWPAFQTSLGSVVNTAKQGAALVTYITGEGDITPPLPDGATPVLSTPIGKLPHSRLPLTVTVGGVSATILFAGIPSGLTGVTQIDFTVPLNAPLGTQPVVVSVGGVAAPAVNLTVTQ